MGNLTQYANDVLGMKTTNPDLTVAVRQKRRDNHNQLVVQCIGHFLNRMQQRDLPAMLIWDKLKLFLHNIIKKDLLDSYRTSSHVEGIIKIPLMKPILGEDKKYHHMLNIPYRYSTFKEKLPSRHALTFITVMAKNNYVQNAPPLHSDSIVKDFKI